MVSRSVAVVGAGKVGVALAGGLLAAGHRVALGVRDPDNPKHEPLRSTLSLTSQNEAAGGAEVVVLAVPATALGEVVPSLGLRSGQVIADATNAVREPIPRDFETVGAFVVSLVPDGVAVVKAFNTIGAEHLGDGRFGERAAFLTIAGDDAGRPVVSALASDLGFEVAELGGRERFGMVEDHARLWIHLAFGCGWGRDFGFTVARP